ncbi:hypothetical protein KW799_01030 [Candidatus Parcubacteria bacterium]|nr:hypothetical protein [Candidatus Parcubacteria bacterium]
MKTFLAELDSLVSRQDVLKASCPSWFEDVQEGEQIAGTCSDRLKSIILAIEEVRQSIGKYDVCIAKEGKWAPSALSKKWAREKFLLSRQILILQELCWVVLAEDLPKLLDKRYITLRKDWQIVYSDAPSREEENALAIKFDLAAIAMMAGETAPAGVGNN